MDLPRDLFGRDSCIVCVGNELSGDDAFGKKVFDGISDIEGVNAIWASTFPENFIEPLRQMPEMIIVLLDAADYGKTPGTLELIDPKMIQQSHFSTHRMPMHLFIRELSKAGKTVYLLGVQVKQVGLGLGLSRPVSEAADELIDFIRDCCI